MRGLYDLEAGVGHEVGQGEGGEVHVARVAAGGRGHAAQQLLVLGTGGISIINIISFSDLPTSDGFKAPGSPARERPPEENPRAKSSAENLPLWLVSKPAVCAVLRCAASALLLANTFRQVLQRWSLDADPGVRPTWENIRYY